MTNLNYPLIFDGAMGTYYTSISHQSLNQCELANLNDETTILKIHKAYILAGAKAIKTNTFGVNPISFETNLMKALIQKGYELAQRAAEGTETLVFADIGPISYLEGEALWEAYREVVDTFIEVGATHFIFETFSNDTYLEELSVYIKEKVSQAYILTSFAINPEGETRLGLPGQYLLEKALQIPTIDAVGFNCISGPTHLLNYIKGLTQKPMAIMPNSGYPTVVGNRTFFASNKDYFAEQMLEIYKQGVSILGGCCGTTPEYIEALVNQLEGQQTPTSAKVISKVSTRVKKETSLVKTKDSLISQLKAGKKIIAVELDPPKDADISFFMEGAQKLKESGVDAITIADCPIARVRVDSSLLACKLKRELGITSIPHMTCRDRNINATKALLLGLNIEGVEDVLVVTGDPIPSDLRDEVKAMFSFNSSILAQYISHLNETTFERAMTIYGALNVNANNFEHQLISAEKKIQNGVSCFLTQPILTQQALENLKLAKTHLKAKILGGIIPVVSYRNACFMNNEIAGIKVSEELMALYKDVSKEEGSNLAVKTSVAIAKAIEDYVDGYYLMTPFKRVDLISQIVKQIRR